MPPEFFDTAEIALNEDGQSWGNLGLWETDDNYSQACRRLAVALGSHAGLDDSSHVLDIGFGCGDQLLLWLRQFHVATLQGVNLSTSQTRRATALLLQHELGQHCAHLRQGDVNESGLWPVPGAPSPSHILCLDSAYHFPERDSFFARATGCLAVGGRLCLTDFVLADGFQPGLRELPLRAMLRAARIPRGNMVTVARYREQLADAGFAAAEVADISSEVMSGFSSWWLRHRHRARHLPLRSRLKYGITARFLDWAYRNGVLRYVVISATRRP